MTNNVDIINAAVALIIKAAILASRFSGRARKRSLKRLASMDINDKDKEIVFLHDKVYQQQMQITILQKGTRKKQKNPRYTIRERLFIICHMETFQVPRRRVTEYLGIARSTFYRWLHNTTAQDEPYLTLFAFLNNDISIKNADILLHCAVVIRYKIKTTQGFL